MNVALLKFMNVDDYLAWGEAEGDGRRTELINGQIVAMSPEQADHNRIKLATAIALRDAVRAAALTCEVFIDGMTVPIEPHTAYEPDVLVHCGERIPSRQLTVPMPIIVVEVISPTSRHSDTSAKLIGYFKLPSVRHYLVIDPDTRTLAHHQRQDTGSPSAQVMSEGKLRLDPPGLEIDIATLFG
ncbi:MAG: Uma2 family endonuclease [Xanthobacteraceae bacterium]|nr:Uma2 family endonuclease [Xanthobacteraceae bacterium]